MRHGYRLLASVLPRLDNAKPGIWTVEWKWTMDWNQDSVMDSIIGLEVSSQTQLLSSKVSIFLDAASLKYSSSICCKVIAIC